MKRLVLIDGHAILHRAYYAFPKTLKTRSGELVNATYGFSRMLLRVIEDLKPTHIAVAFDLPKPTFRHYEFVGYQAQRPKMDLELKGQIERVYQVVRALNIPIFTKESYEADDVIATLVEQAHHQFEIRDSRFEVIIVTGDKDMMQLVKGKVKIYAPVKGFSQAKLFGPKEVEELLGIKPKQIIDYKALVGDPSDNYPGVSGIGPKTAVKLLEEYKDLDTIYRRVEELPEKISSKLVEGAESAALSRKLAQIVTDVPIKLSLKACRVHDYDHEKARGLFEELGFKSLISRLPGMEEPEKEKEKKKEKQMKLI